MIRHLVLVEPLKKNNIIELENSISKQLKLINENVDYVLSTSLFRNINNVNDIRLLFYIEFSEKSDIERWKSEKYHQPLKQIMSENAKGTVIDYDI